MNLDISPEPPPLTLDEDGVARVAGTRVTLKTVVEAFLHRSHTPEQIAEDFRLTTGDVYSVIGYCLRRKAEVNAYLKKLVQRDEERRIEMEAKGRSPSDWQHRLRNEPAPPRNVGTFSG